MPNLRSNFRLTQEMKDDARAALMILDGSSLSLEAAAKIAVQTYTAETRVDSAITVDEAVKNFLKSPSDRGYSRGRVSVFIIAKQLTERVNA